MVGAPGAQGPPCLGPKPGRAGGEWVARGAGLLGSSVCGTRFVCVPGLFGMVIRRIPLFLARQGGAKFKCGARGIASKRGLGMYYDVKGEVVHVRKRKGKFQYAFRCIECEEAFCFWVREEKVRNWPICSSCGRYHGAAVTRTLRWKDGLREGKRAANPSEPLRRLR